MCGTQRVFAFCFLLFALCFVGCKTQTKVGTVEAGEVKEQEEFFDSMRKQAFQYNTISARTHVELEVPGREFATRVDIKMVHDSAFQLSVQPFLGIEVFRIEFNRDSVKVIDRMNKRYVAESYSGLKGKTPVPFNFYNLQSLFTNRIFVPGEQTVSPELYKRFKLTQEGGTIEAKTKDAMELLYTFMADGEEKLLSTHITDKSERYAVLWLYRDFRIVEKQTFPMLMDIRVSTEEDVIGGIKISYSRIQQDIPVNIVNPIPDKYKKVTFAEIIKGLTGK